MLKFIATAIVNSVFICVGLIVLVAMVTLLIEVIRAFIEPIQRKMKRQRRTSNEP